MTVVDRLLSAATMPVARSLEQALEGKDIGVHQAAELLNADGLDFYILLMTADHLRKETSGDVVSYVVNRNVNFTNVCVKRCSFCAFSRTYRSQEGYFLPTEEIVRRAREALDFGATEICVQAGLPPDMPGDFYISLCRTLKEAVPEIHIHAFSAEEVLYGCHRSGLSYAEYLGELKNAGVGSLPGTSAEILDDEVRNRISPGRITTQQWIDIVTTAHALGIPTTCTIMYGHVETPQHVAAHLVLLRDLQRRHRGFTEFVPLSFVHTEAPLYTDGLIKGVRPGPTGIEVLKVHAVARLVLNRDIPNIQVSWVKEGLKLAQACLAAGANDFGGTLINESISTAAGATHGQLVRPRDLRRFIRDSRRIPAERSTLYRILHRFDEEDSTILEPLDRISDEETSRFGSYNQLTRTEGFRYAKKFVPAGR
ncbi:MAG: 5-amino-6-(D-ribitylamino)uracil--L-tyrosine 4-hydroxyphenyl transferase CofH [Acidobacteria bacterium]|nr:5-amino-6-(D-ribitylamino)uracil--L-tyrosine 4-hydroxyphenyl transferase CofH [Acidobacteriota bacterium]